MIHSKKLKDCELVRITVPSQPSNTTTGKDDKSWMYHDQIFVRISI